MPLALDDSLHLSVLHRTRNEEMFTKKSIRDCLSVATIFYTFVVIILLKISPLSLPKDWSFIVHTLLEFHNWGSFMNVSASFVLLTLLLTLTVLFKER